MKIVVLEHQEERFLNVESLDEHIKTESENDLVCVLHQALCTLRYTEAGREFFCFYDILQ